MSWMLLLTFLTISQSPLHLCIIYIDNIYSIYRKYDSIEMMTRLIDRSCTLGSLNCNLACLLEFMKVLLFFFFMWLLLLLYHYHHHVTRRKEVLYIAPPPSPSLYLSNKTTQILSDLNMIICYQFSSCTYHTHYDLVACCLLFGQFLLLAKFTCIDLVYCLAVIKTSLGNSSSSLTLMLIFFNSYFIFELISIELI